MSSRSILFNLGHRNSFNISRYRRPFTVTASPAAFSKKYGPITPPDHNAHQTVICLGCKDFS